MAAGWKTARQNLSRSYQQMKKESNKKRIFLAIFPPGEVVDSLAKIQDDIMQYDSYLRFVDKKQMHVTVRFLGREVSSSSFANIKSDLEVYFEDKNQFNLKMGEVHYGFKGRKWPRILHVKIPRNQYLDQLLSGIEDVVSKEEYTDINDIVHGKSQFHITLARTKNRLTEEVVRGVRKILKRAEVWSGFKVRSICLVESTLTQKGPVYDIAKRYKLNSRF